MDTLNKSDDSNSTDYFVYQVIAVDIVLFAIHENERKVLLVKRTSDPYSGTWSLTGTIVQRSESIDHD